MDPYESDSELILLDQRLNEGCPSPPSEKSKEGPVLSNVPIRLADPVPVSDLDSRSTDCPGWTTSSETDPGWPLRRLFGSDLVDSSSSGFGDTDSGEEEVNSKERAGPWDEIRLDISNTHSCCRAPN
ncbi:unnamed protein product [Cuscuta epithymum]|uniref:Uncharacterized protein n=1 Tax=Cuscuta epithymum TaxID=186058 RepID=A0AAV0EVA3_9ASTE|nr:unnamed protein product [Cuscuta epithymum]CAH9127196.1 unnamed protein product [Cuscuta epithymum]